MDTHKLNNNESLSAPRGTYAILAVSHAPFTLVLNRQVTLRAKYDITTDRYRANVELFTFLEFGTVEVQHATEQVEVSFEPMTIWNPKFPKPLLLAFWLVVSAVLFWLFIVFSLLF